MSLVLFMQDNGKTIDTEKHKHTDTNTFSGSRTTLRVKSLNGLPSSKGSRMVSLYTVTSRLNVISLLSVKITVSMLGKSKLWF